jgi:hypothetical protein
MRKPSSISKRSGVAAPTTSESIVRYLAAYGALLSSNTLRTHLAALAQHRQHGFTDPTKTARVRDVLRRIQAEHPRPVKQAEALALQKLEMCIAGLGEEMASEQPAVHMRAARDQALILLSFWRAFRADEMCRLRIERQLRAGLGLDIFLPSGEGDRANRGRTLHMPALKRLCPVEAYGQWLDLSELVQAAMFRGIDRWGHLGDQALNANSLSRLLRQTFLHSGMSAEGYTAHSLRCGFATCATRNRRDSKSLMVYVGWRDVQSAARYIDADEPFGDWAR